MPLVPTPALQAQLVSIAVNFIDGIMSGTGVTEDNMATYPEESKIKAATQFGQDMAMAVDAWLTAVQIIVPPGLSTAGPPTSHLSIAPWLTIKV